MKNVIYEIFIFLFLISSCKNEEKNIINLSLDSLKKNENKTVIHDSYSLKTDKLLKNISEGNIINNLNTEDKVIALSFDACESNVASYFDHSILDYLIKEEIPFTIFVSGRFAKRNSDELKNISKYPFIEIENHSMNHHQHTETLSDEDIKMEVIENEKLIENITGRKTKFFRFPGGNYNENSLRIVSNLNYPVVHWSFASGDPDKNISPKKLFNWVISKSKPGSILIFHINGRGFSTGEALPDIVKTLKAKSFRFVKLEDYLYKN